VVAVDRDGSSSAAVWGAEAMETDEQLNHTAITPLPMTNNILCGGTVTCMVMSFPFLFHLLDSSRRLT
jgi:hypothetical protein